LAAAEADVDGGRSVLIDAVDEMTVARFEARKSLADLYGVWVGDQHLFQSELRLGAFAAALDLFIPNWTLGGDDWSTEDIVAGVRHLILEPGADQDGNAAQPPPWVAPS